MDGQGLDYSRSGLRKHRQRVGLLLQNPDDQLLAPIIRDDVALGPRNLGLSEREVERRVREALELFDLEELADSPTYPLSTGQKKRVALAGLLSMSPEVVLLDEPTAGLDPGGVVCLRQALDLLTERGVHLLLSTHDLDFAYDWCSELALLEQGVIVAQEEADRVFSRFGEVTGLPLLYELKHAVYAVGEAPSGSDRRQLLERVRTFKNTLEGWKTR